MALVPSVNTRSFIGETERFSQGAIQARSAMRTRPEPPPKTVGGAISSAAGMGMAGYMVGSMGAGAGAGAAAGAGAGAAAGSAGGPWGAVIGAGIGLASYLLS